MEEEDEERFIYAPSSSSEEDWGDGSWEVDGIIGEHITMRGERLYQVAWGGWSRPDGTNWTWEKEGGTTMQDLSGMQRRWRGEKVQEQRRHAEDPLVSPFYPSKLPNAQNDNDEEQEPQSRTRRKKKPLMMYAFTELNRQAQEMGLAFKDGDFEQSASLPSAFERLREMRNKRDAALKSLDVTLPEAVSQNLYKLGPAPQPEGSRKQASLSRRMESLQVTEEQPSIPEPPVSANQSAVVAPPRATHIMPNAFQTPRYHAQIPNRPILPLPRRSPSASGSSTMATFSILTTSSTVVRAVATPSTISSVSVGWSNSTLLGVSTNQELPSGSPVYAPGGGRTPESARNPALVPAGERPHRPNAREALESKWTAAAGATGAAPVKIVNDLDDSQIPAVDPEMFTYLETDGPGVTRPQEEFMEACDCKTSCTAAFCSCQDDSEVQADDDDETKAFPYDANGLFTFSEDIGSYVIECNKNCLCDASCPSRVAQRPRSFPIEIFRTAKYGWGVRTPVALPRGRVLGVYTGELLSRHTARTYSPKRASYVADLDFMITGSQEGYSVDAYNCGNWTRFVNHSCNPVCVLYSVIWDSVPSMHQPKLAFVTKTDIPARTELTIDYCPQARKGKGKAPRRKMPDTPDCMCDAENCRGFIYPT